MLTRKCASGRGYRGRRLGRFEAADILPWDETSIPRYQDVDLGELTYALSFPLTIS